MFKKIKDHLKQLKLQSFPIRRPKQDNEDR